MQVVKLRVSQGGTTLYAGLLIYGIPHAIARHMILEVFGDGVTGQRLELGISGGRT